MRKTFLLVAVAAALGTAPAGAQNNATEAGTNAANTAATETNAMAGTNVAVTDTTAANALEPAPPPTASDLSTRAASQPEERRGFPWGLIGLVGLVGLLGRKRGG